MRLNHMKLPILPADSTENNVFPASQMIQSSLECYSLLPGWYRNELPWMLETAVHATRTKHTPEIFHSKGYLQIQDVNMYQ